MSTYLPLLVSLYLPPSLPTPAPRSVKRLEDKIDALSKAVASGGKWPVSHRRSFGRRRASGEDGEEEGDAEVAELNRTVQAMGRLLEKVAAEFGVVMATGAGDDDEDRKRLKEKLKA